MPSLKQLAVCALAAAVFGCDGNSNSDVQVRDAISRSRVAAAVGDDSGLSNATRLLDSAANVTGASPASIAQMKGARGELFYEAALQLINDVHTKELNCSRIVLEIAGLGAQLGNGAAMMQGYLKLDPKAAKLEIEKNIAQAKGSPSQPKWFADSKIELPSLDAANQQVARLNDEIAKRQAEIKALDAQRIAALEVAEVAIKEAVSAQGRASVDAFTKGSNARKKAADFQTQIDIVNGALLPLQEDLGIAQGEQAAVEQAIKELTDESSTLDQGWKDVQNRIAAQLELLKQITSAADAAEQPGAAGSAAGKSIAGKAALLVQDMKETDSTRENAAGGLNSAIQQFEAAATAAGRAEKELSQLKTDQPSVASVATVVQGVLSPQSYKLRQATANRLLAELYIGKAAGASARIKLREMLVPALQAAQIAAPVEITDTSFDKDFPEGLSAANEEYEKADKLLTEVIDGGGGTAVAGTIKSARLARIYLLYSRQQWALMSGDTATAQQFDATAREAVKAAFDNQTPLGRLPGDLALAIPKAPPPPSTAPAEEPTTESPTAPADSTTAPAVTP